MRLTIVQYAGDYREAFERFERGGRATYQAQRYSVGFVGSLADQLDQVAVVCALTESPYDIVLSNGVRAVGAGFKSGFHSRDLVPLVARTTPDRLVLATPMVPLLKWARKNRVPTIATLADSFQEKGLRSRIRHWGLAAELNRANVAWVGNHGIAACLSLLKIGVDGPKIIPWDWPPSHRPSEHSARTRGRPEGDGGGRRVSRIRTSELRHRYGHPGRRWPDPDVDLSERTIAPHDRAALSRVRPGALPNRWRARFRLSTRPASFPGANRASHAEPRNSTNSPLPALIR